MNERLRGLREETLRRAFKKYRAAGAPAGRRVFLGSEGRQATDLFIARCRAERPIVFPDERIVFTRSQTHLQAYRFNRLAAQKFLRRALSVPRRLLKRFCHVGSGKTWFVDKSICNTTPDHALFLKDGLDERIAVAREGLRQAKGRRERDFLRAAIDGLEALKELVSRYAQEAKRVGNDEMAEMLSRIPAAAPQTFHEALQSLRILQFALYLHGAELCGLGRMDQYLRPFYEKDLADGRLTREAAHDLLAEFFMALNRDADLYPGIQQGDNGQSVMLGGCRPEDGASAINDLTYLILEVSRDVRLIDPKINLRVDRNTPVELLELGSELTKCGLGFPQYSNDEVVIPALVKKGYRLEDARDYTVAACWEFVIPGKSMDLVNLAAVSFPHAVDKALRQEAASGGFDEASFRCRIRAEIFRQVERIVSMKVVRHPAPTLSAFFTGALESRTDITEFAPYRNIGIHGAGSANAADQIAGVLGVEKVERVERVRRLVEAEDRNFEGDEELLRFLREDCPKVGNGDAAADKELNFLFDAFADAAERFSTDKVRVRPGSGSAMYYVWMTDTTRDRSGWMIEPVVGATSDGRLRNAPLASSLAPSHEARVGGILSVLKSFSGVDYSRIMNGGPITVEFDHTVFKTDEGVKKLAQLIRCFVALGEQQLQLNVLNVAELEDALAHPELHRNLVVRVWGWSGYFCELDREFQMQIIKRHKYGC